MSVRDRESARERDRECEIKSERERGDVVCELVHLHLCVTTNNEDLSSVI